MGELRAQGADFVGVGIVTGGRRLEGGGGDKAFEDLVGGSVGEGEDAFSLG